MPPALKEVSFLHILLFRRISLKACTYQLKGDCFAEREWAEKFQVFLDTESILEVNELTKLLDGHSVYMDKLLKLSKYANAETLGQVCKLAERINEFDYLSGICDAQGLGKYCRIQTCGLYRLSVVGKTSDL